MIYTFTPKDRDFERWGIFQPVDTKTARSLARFSDKGDFWTVEWRTGDGEEHTSAISKMYLTVMNAGICLDDLDEDFDLQSLLGVVEQREY